MSKIKRLEDKYLVIKTDDLEYFFEEFRSGNMFATDEQQAFIDTIPFKTVLEQVQKTRESNGKSKNHYVVLNMDDDIDITHLREVIDETNLDITGWGHEGKMETVKVEDIAVDLVNAILKAKSESP